MPLVIPMREELPKLTERECEILQLASMGLGQKQIARNLGVVRKTVENHRHRIRKKLKTLTPEQTLVRAIELGYLKILL
jgi:DNA-binding NarL/FixJ family response regulator